MISEIPDTISEKSFLVVNCGHSSTTAVLFDVVAGSYRLIARASALTTAREPWRDVTQGVRQAIDNLSQITGRLFFNERGDIIQPARRDGGVDHFAATFSAAPPLDVILAGLFDNVSLHSARTVLKRNYAREMDAFSLNDPREKGEQVAAVANQQPDLIFISGGTDGGAAGRLMSLVDTVALGISQVKDARKPEVIFAGNEEIRDVVKARFEDVTAVHTVANLRPELGVERLDDATHMLAELYRTLKVERLPGIREVRDWCHTPIMATTEALTTITNYLAALHNTRTLSVGLGNNGVTLVAATPHETATAVLHNVGMGKPLQQLVARIDPARINRWLPIPVAPDEIANFMMQKAIYPRTIPVTAAENMLEQAVAREVLRSAVKDTAVQWQLPIDRELPVGLLVVHGRLLTKGTHKGLALLTLLDGLRPSGVFALLFDQYSILPALGALANVEPLLVVQTLENDVLPRLGWVIAPTGKAKMGQKALKISIETDSGKLPEVEVEFGRIEVIPLTETAQVTIKPARNLDIGLGAGRGQTLTLPSSVMGLIVDARGRPFVQPAKGDTQHDLVNRWLQDVGVA